MSTEKEVDEGKMAQLPFGTALRLRREAQGVLQRDLARTINVDPSTLSKWEGQQKAPRDRRALLKLAQALNCTVEEIAAGLVPSAQSVRQLPTAALNPTIARVVQSLGRYLNDSDWNMVAAYIQGLADSKKPTRGPEQGDGDEELNNPGNGMAQIG